MTTTDTGALRLLATRPTARGGYLTVSGAYHIDLDGDHAAASLGLLEVAFSNPDGNLTVALELATARALIDALTEALGDAR